MSKELVEREAELAWPNHTFARGVFLQGARWQAENDRKTKADIWDECWEYAEDMLAMPHENRNPYRGE